MADLRTDYQDDVLDASENTARVYDLVDSDGNVVLAGVHLEDKTVYTTEGDDYGAADINTQNTKINQINNDLSVSVRSGIIAIPQIDTLTCLVNIDLRDYDITDATANNTFIFVQVIGDYNTLGFQFVTCAQILNNTHAQISLRATSGATIPSGANMYAYISVHHVR